MKNHDVIDCRCPEIRGYNWPDQNRLGWRWYRNVMAGTVMPNQHLLQQLQYEHGLTNVTLGDPWSEENMVPYIDVLWVGIYIRDVPSLVGKFLNELEKWWDNY